MPRNLITGQEITGESGGSRQQPAQPTNLITGKPIGPEVPLAGVPEGTETQQQPRSSLAQTFLAGPTISIAEAIVNRPKEIVGTVIEGAGAAGGAALGGAVGGLPGAIIGGGGGARVARTVGDFLLGEETTPEELKWAGLTGAAGPIVGRVAQFGGRWLTQVPSQRTAIKRAVREGQRRAAGARAAELDQQLKQLTEKVDQLKSRKLGDVIAVATKNGKPAVGPDGKPVTITVTEEFLGVQKKALAALEKSGLRNPEAAIERARAKVVAGKFPSGRAGTALGVIIGQATIGDVFSGGAVGFIVGRIGGRAAERLAANRAFVSWTTGLRGQSASDALFTFTTNVLLQPDQTLEQLAASEAFFGELLDYTSGVVAGAALADETDQAEADQLAQEALREGRQQLDRLLVV